MNKRILLSLAACAILAGCDEETRKGKLELSGSTPVRIVDEGGRAVDFVSGELKVELGFHSGKKISVQLEQAGRKARFTMKAPAGADTGNFTVKGRDVGQPVDIASTRTLSKCGEPYTRPGTGTSCGFNGRWETEETWRNCREDFAVAFSDANNGSPLGQFASLNEKYPVFVSERNIWCRERPERDHPGRPGPFVKADAVTKKLAASVEKGIKFD